MWEGEGDPVEGGDVWVECWAVIRGVQKPALRGTAEDQQHQTTIWKISLETLLSPTLDFSSKLRDKFDWIVV